MAGLKRENETAAAQMELDLATVQRVTQQVSTFGLETLTLIDAPIFRWRLLINPSESKVASSGFFAINNSHLFGQLKLTSSNNQYNFSLTATDMKTGKTAIKLDPFQFFICKVKNTYSANYGIREECFSSMFAFNLRGSENQVNFKFNFCNATEVTVELHQEPLAMVEYRSPYKNTAVGKIINLSAQIAQANYLNNEILSVSPRFNVGSSDQLVMVSFSCSKLPNISHNVGCGLSATLHILSPSYRYNPSLFFTATFTIFSQKENMKDLVHKVVFRRDEIKDDAYSTLLAFNKELEPYLKDNYQRYGYTLYYKVEIVPHP